MGVHALCPYIYQQPSSIPCSPTIQSALSIQLEYKLPSLLEQGRVKLVVLDSIAALFRAEFGIGQTSHRAELLRAFGAQLWRLSEVYGAAVVCVNQVCEKTL